MGSFPKSPPLPPGAGAGVARQRGCRGGPPLALGRALRLEQSERARHVRHGARRGTDRRRGCLQRVLQPGGLGPCGGLIAGRRASLDARRVCGCWECWGEAASGSGTAPLPRSSGGGREGGPLSGPSVLSSAIGASVGGMRASGAAGGARVGVDEPRRGTTTCLSCAVACGSCRGMVREAGRSAQKRARAGHTHGL